MNVILLEQNISYFFNDIKKLIIERASQKDQNLSNKIPNSFDVGFKEETTKYKAYLAAWKWIIAAWETGRGSGKFPPRDNIESWIEKRGIEPEDGTTKEQLAFLIQRSIGEKGTLLNRGQDSRFSGRNSGTITDFINEYAINELLTNIGGLVRSDINDYLKGFKDVD